jgi:hypothetical protein
LPSKRFSAMATPIGFGTIYALSRDPFAGPKNKKSGAGSPGVKAILRRTWLSTTARSSPPPEDRVRYKKLTFP